MNEERKSGVIASVVQWVILGMSCLLLCWTASAVVDQGKELSQQKTALQYHSARLDKIENAIIGLTAISGDVKVLAQRIEAIREGQIRMENIIESQIGKL